MMISGFGSAPFPPACNGGSGPCHGQPVRILREGPETNITPQELSLQELRRRSDLFVGTRWHLPTKPSECPEESDSLRVPPVRQEARGLKTPEVSKTGELLNRMRGCALHPPPVMCAAHDAVQL